MRKIVFLAAFVFLTVNTLFAQQPLDGRWTGAIDILNQHFDIIVNFTTRGDSISGTIDVPQQGAQAKAISNIKYDSARVSFELHVAPGNIAAFSGVRKDSVIEGEFKQMNYTGRFFLTTGTLASSLQAPAKSDTVKEEPVNYKAEEVSFQSDSVRLAGTLTIPEGEGKFPAVILITGSGPQNRDEEIMGFKPFKIIADHLTRNGIAVLRYDDRGVGGSTGSMIRATTEDFTDDALAAFKYLSSRPEINSEKIGMLGHSEGGIIAPLAASRNKKIGFLILMSGTGVPGKQLLREQLRLILKAQGADSSAIASQLKMQSGIINAVITNRGWKAVREEISSLVRLQLEQMSLEQRKLLTDEKAYIKGIVDAQVNSMNSPWFKFFLSYDPLPALRKVKAPVLMLFGGLDTQVSTLQNRDKMLKALKAGGNNKVKAEEFPKANHLYQEAVTGSPMEYAGLKKEFVSGFLDTITQWIKENTGK